MDKVKENILSLLIYASSTLTIRQLNGDYWNIYGEIIPYETFGFNSFEDYLRSIPDAVKISGSGPLAEVLLANPLKPFECELIVKKRRNRYRRRYQHYGPNRNEETDPYLIGLLARYTATTLEDWGCENRRLNSLVSAAREKNRALTLTNELLLSRLKQLQAESASRLKLTGYTQSASVDQSAGHNNKTVIQQSASQISNSNMVNSYCLNKVNGTQWDSDGDNHTPMEKELDEWDYNMAKYYGKMPNGDEEPHKNRSSCEKVAEFDEWDYYMAKYYGKMPNVFEEVAHDNIYEKVSRGAEEKGKISDYKPGKRVTFNL